MLPGSGRLSRLLPSSSSISMKMTQKFSVLSSSSSNTIISDPVNNYMRPKPGHKLQFISPPKLVTARYFSSDPNDEPAYPVGDESTGGPAPIVPSTVTVPEDWPVLPIVAVNRHPVFPKFIKIVEVNDTKLIEILRRKV